MDLADRGVCPCARRHLYLPGLRSCNFWFGSPILSQTALRFGTNLLTGIPDGCFPPDRITGNAQNPVKSSSNFIFQELDTAC